jgi:hypothetical protein
MKRAILGSETAKGGFDNEHMSLKNFLTGGTTKQPENG